MEGSLKRKNK